MINMSLMDNLAGAISDSAGTGNTNNKALQQYEPCKIKGCKYLNEEGFCSKETCVVLNENPSTAMMTTKNCMFCGSKFTTNLDSMQIQLCPECLAGVLAATKRGGDENETNAFSGTVNVADQKLKMKSVAAKAGTITALTNALKEQGINLQGLNIEGLNLESLNLGNIDIGGALGGILGNMEGLDLGSLDLSGALGDVLGNLGNFDIGNLGDLGNIDFSNIAGDIANLQDLDFASMAEDLGAGLATAAAKKLLAGNGGHPCMFCGTAIVENPSIFFPCCPKCFANLVIVTTVCTPAILGALAICNPKNLVLAGQTSHCYACDDW